MHAFAQDHFFESAAAVSTAICVTIQCVLGFWWYSTVMPVSMFDALFMLNATSLCQHSLQKRSRWAGCHEQPHGA